VWMTEPSISIESPRLVGGPLSLRSGRRVWVTAGTEEVMGGRPEPIPATAIVEPVWPAEHGVTAPGVFIRGAHIG
jgi:hypothetical protein